MGEKIRDITTLDIAGGQLTVELNEGSSGNERHIHLQTPQFRYLFREQDFIALMCKALRADAELRYMKDGGAKSDD